jgi:DNA-binding LacI/PurR family transcriptional regulator
VVWSARSSESNWVPDEATYGRDHNMLIPVSLDGTPPPLGFQQLLTQDLAGWDGGADDVRIRKVVAAVRTHLRGAEPSSSRPAQGDATRTMQPPVNTETLERQYRATRNKRVFLIVGSFNEEWQISLNFQLMQAVQRADLSCTVLVPTEDHTVDQQRKLLEGIQADGGDYLGGLMICSGWPDHLMAKLLDLVTQKSLPVVLIDRNPPPELADIPAKISYVSVSDAAGGQLAADAVLELLDGAPIRRILVVAGFAKRNRHDSFHKRIKSSKKLSGCEVVVTEDGKFDRWIAENVTFNLLSDALKAKKPFEVIFCTADSMTVGCLDAIARIPRWGRRSKPRVIGYDATPTTRNMVESRRSPLVRIVVQDTRELASAAVEQLIRMHQSENGAANEVVWIEPYLYPRLKTL